MTPGARSTSRRRLLVALQWALTLATVAAIIWFLAPNFDDIAAVTQVTGALALLMAAGLAIQFAANGMVFKLFVEHFRTPMPFGQAVLVGLMDAALNYLPMKAGTVATGVVLVRRYGVHVSDFAAIVAGSTVLNAWLSAVLSGVCLLALQLEAALAVSLIVLPTLAVTALMAWGRRHKTVATADESSRLRRGFVRAVGGMALIFRSPTLVGGLAVLNLVRLVAVALVLYASFAAVAHPVSAVEALAIAGLAFVLGRLAVLPGGLGFREAGVAGIAALIGIPGVFGLAAAVIDRGVMAAALVALGVPATVIVLGRSRSALAQATGSDRSVARDTAPVALDPVGNYYDKYNTRNPVSRYLMNRFRTELDALWTQADARSQLDVGCGEGIVTCDWATALGERGRVVGLDREDARLRSEWEARRHDNLEFVSGDAAELAFGDREFDLVSAIEVLEHLPDPRAALAEMARVTDRYLLLSVPREPLWRILNMARGAHWRTLGNTPGHVQHWSRNRFVRFASEFGDVVAVSSPLPWTIVLVRVEGPEGRHVTANDLSGESEPRR